MKPFEKFERDVSRFTFHVSEWKGFTLYEVLIYLALFFMLSVLIVGAITQLLTAGFKSARAREVVSSVASAMDTVAREAAYARNVYQPTSVFDTNASQLSLETAADPPPGEATVFIDFYLDNGRVFMKREAAQALALTSDRVTVGAFRVTRLNPVTTSDSLRIAIAARHRFSRGAEDDSFSATTTATLRRY